MGIATAITAAAAVGGALISSSGSRNAADTVSDSTDAQIALQREIYNDTVARQEPFYQTGVAANSAASNLLGLGGGQQQPIARDFRDLSGGQSQFNQPSGVAGLPSSFGGDGGGGFSRNVLEQLRGNGNFQQNGLLGGQLGQMQNHSRGRNGITGGGPQTQGQASIISDGQGGFRPTAGGSTGSIQVGGLAQGLRPQDGGQQTSNGQPIYQNQQLTEIQESPGYQFRLQEGQNQLETGAAARGGLLSGGHIRQGTRYAQDYASGEYNNRFNQLQALQSGGQAAASNTQAAGSQFGSNASNALANNANFAANQQQQRASSFGGALGTVGGLIGGAL